ncbi:hypothetical protein H4683_003171 [Filibacter limicola]|uniref:Uncharacterized protein n=1 Tax=Sporosarcina limicola TaxID=34101 RepID=A0A927RE75_9BACL|nr:hypothetical protein [Sporosarcina limicola]
MVRRLLAIDMDIGIVAKLTELDEECVIEIQKKML